jgi:hypothetical protein
VPPLPRLRIPPYVFSHQPRRSVLRGIFASDISTIRHGVTSQSPRVGPSTLTMMIFPWTKMTFTSFTCKCLVLPSHPSRFFHRFWSRFMFAETLFNRYSRASGQRQ